MKHFMLLLQVKLSMSMKNHFINTLFSCLHSFSITFLFESFGFEDGNRDETFSFFSIPYIGVTHHVTYFIIFVEVCTYFPRFTKHQNLYKI